MLSGLIRCSCCGKSYRGNRKQAKNKPMYIFYRCSYRGVTSSKVCDNKEIKSTLRNMYYQN
ncbi:TPA: recombinase zinc beta ribbon domain-containing protein [Clostridium sporogenes]